MGMLLAPITPAFADSVSVNFENPPYLIGSISGQDGWSNAVNPAYDQGVVANTFGYSSFGSQSFRISDAVTSGSFGDWVFAKPLTDAVGEASASAGTFSVGTRQRHFEMQFDIASASPSSQQPGLHVSVSPDRGDGSRMSYLRFQDDAGGIDVFFDDVQGTFDSGTTNCPTSLKYPLGTKCANFVETQVASGLNRSTAHTVKLTMDTLDGPSNDVVKVWIDGILVHTGTSWEDYYRFDNEAAAEPSPRIVKTVIFQSRTGSGPVTNPADLGKGFLFDNFSMSSGPIPPVLVSPPTMFAQCKNNGWQTFNNPSFKNQGQCVSFVATHMHIVSAGITYTANLLVRHAIFVLDSALNNGTFFYWDANLDWYTVDVSDVNVNSNTVWFAGKVTHASQPSWVGNWLFAKAVDNSPDQIWGSFTTQSSAESGVTNMTNPADGPFTVTSGNISIH